MNHKLFILAMAVCASSAYAADVAVDDQTKKVECHKKHIKHSPEKLFDRMDSNKDSLMSREEFLKAHDERKKRHSKKCKR